MLKRMLDGLRRRDRTSASFTPFAPAAPVCKCCGEVAEPVGTVDFSKNCEEPGGYVLPPSGIAIAYHRCPACGFLFTPAFDDFSTADFARHIYNDGYRAIDPAWENDRPAASARFVAEFLPQGQDLRFLDYGGGSGRLAERLRAGGYRHASTYDPYTPEFAARPQDVFDVITCLEVAEHTPTPRETFADICALLAPQGLLVFSTLLQGADAEREGLRWWYVAPRNGHISIYTRKALKALFAGLGFNFASYSDLVHFAFREVPPFAAHVFRRAGSPDTAHGPAPG